MRVVGDPSTSAGRSARHRYRVVRRRAWLGWLSSGALLAVAAILVTAAVGEAAGAVTVPVPAVALTVASGLTVMGALWLRPHPDAQRWWRGAGGESATAALLERLPTRRWVVLHDRRVPGSRANVDHLLIGPTGVWLIDSKSFRAPVRARWRSVWVGERRLDSGPSRWEAEMVQDRLGVAVVAVIAVHGTGLKPRGRRTGGVWVVPAQAVSRRVRRGRRVFNRRQVDALAERADRLLPAARADSLGRR